MWPPTIRREHLLDQENETMKRVKKFALPLIGVGVFAWATSPVFAGLSSSGVLPTKRLRHSVRCGASSSGSSENPDGPSISFSRARVAAVGFRGLGKP